MKRIISKGLSIACIGLFFLVVSALHAEEIQSNLILSQHLDIRVETDRVFMDVQDAEISDVLKALARKANFDVIVSEGISGRVTIRLNGETLENTLKKLCQNRAIVFEYSPETKTYRIIKAGAYAEGDNHSVEKPTRSATTVLKPKQKTRTGKKGDQKEESAPDIDDSNKAQTHVRESERQYDSKGRRLYKPGEILVRFKEGTTAEQISALHQSFGNTVIKSIGRLRLQQVKLKEGLSITEAIALYTASENVENAEAHALRYPNKTIPNDTNFSSQWGLDRIQVPEVWDIVKGNPDLIIAVIDTGVDYLHPDLANNIWMNPAELNGSAGADDDENGYLDDILGWDFAGNNKDNPNDSDNDPIDTDTGGHGTHVSGIIAAEANNGRGVAGINWNTKIMALKVKADNTEFIVDIDVIQAIYYAMDMGARIVNCSFGGEKDSVNEKSAFADLGNAGILAVCAAGNGDDSGNGIDTDGSIKNYPSSYPFDSIISVAAGDSNDNLAGFSNYGVTSVDLMAPGVNIESTVPDSSYTQAFVTANSGGTAYNFTADGISFAGTTDSAGFSALAYDCGLGYPENIPAEVNGNIALIQRGVIHYSEKAANAIDAGAAAVIIYNNVTGSFEGTLGKPGDWPPVVSISQEDGAQLKSLIESLTPPTVTVINAPVELPAYYASKQGTSMAAPHVAGVAGLLLSLDSTLTATEIKSTILNTVDKIDTVSNKLVSGGRINALRAICSSIGAVPFDLSCDMEINLADAIIALQVLSGMNPQLCSPRLPSGIESIQDGKIGLPHAIYILQKISNLRNRFD